MGARGATEPRQLARRRFGKGVAAGGLILGLLATGATSAPAEPIVGLPECGPPPVVVSPCPAVAPLVVAKAEATVQRVFVVGRGFRPGARASFPETGIEVRTTTVLSGDLLRVDIVVPPTAGEGGAIIHVANLDGRSSVCTACGPTVVRPPADPGPLANVSAQQIDWIIRRAGAPPALAGR